MTLCALAVLLSPVFAADIVPPQPPHRGEFRLDRASDVALDASQTLLYLEQGQRYFADYPKQKRTEEENRAYLKFLEDYQRELDTFRGELEVLRLWNEKKSALTPQ